LIPEHVPNASRQYIEDDIIHYEDDRTMPPQLKAEGVLFIYKGTPTCFWPPQSGG
jgi:hypothetical protein